MAEIVGVRFKDAGKIYYFDPEGESYQPEELVVVETSRGTECGTIALANREVQDEGLTKPLRRVLRRAGREDRRRLEENRAKEKRAYRICQEKIAKNGLEMKLVGVEYAFDGSKIIGYFTADGRVDFRELVKELASVFRTRIELRQIGVRDEAKMLGGLGICGRPFCCSTFLGEFQPVSIKMAKEQGLSLNPTKISGACGRLMCCLKYEQPAYEELLRLTPKVGALVHTPDGKGTVTEVDLLRGRLKVHLQDSPEGSVDTYCRQDLRPASAPRGEQRGGKREQSRSGGKAPAREEPEPEENL